MKRIITIAALLILFPQIPRSQVVDISDFTKMSFDAAIKKKDLVVREPILVKLRYSNKSARSLTTLPPIFISDVKLIVTRDGISEVFDMTLLRPNTRRLLRDFRSGDFVEEDIILDTNLDLFFPHPGDYTVRFELGDGRGGVKTLQSEPNQVTINDAQGIDKKAFDFIVKYQRASSLPQVLFSWSDKINKHGLTPLEQFVQRYSDSVYGEHAIYSLGVFYLHSVEDLEKARVEMNKIRTSGNEVLAKRAAESLTEIENRMREKERLKSKESGE